MKTGSTDRLVRTLYTSIGGGLGAIIDGVWHHNVTSRAKHGLTGGSTGKPDCALLYLLTAAFQRKFVFEIGTYVGSSALAMQLGVEKSGGGQVVTCDPTDYGCVPAGIRFINESDDLAIERLAGERATIDFVFADWVPSVLTISRLNEIGDARLIFSAHDFQPGDKGEISANLFSQHYARIDSGLWFLPEQQPITVGPGLLVDQATAVFIPTDLLISLDSHTPW